jgi:hypothetical protein
MPAQFNCLAHVYITWSSVFMRSVQFFIVPYFARHQYCKYSGWDLCGTMGKQPCFAPVQKVWLVFCIWQSRYSVLQHRKPISVDTWQKRCCAAAAICAHWSWDNCIGGIDTGVFCLLSDVIKADLYYLFVLLVCGLVVVPEAQSMWYQMVRR